MKEIKEAIEKAHKPGFINGMYIFPESDLLELLFLAVEKQREEIYITVQSHYRHSAETDEIYGLGEISESIMNTPLITDKLKES